LYNIDTPLYNVPQIEGKLYIRDKTDLWGFLQNGEYEPQETKIVKDLVKPGNICLDIGANIGYYTVLMSKLGGRVWSFEPEPSNVELLRKNVEINNIYAHVFDIAISDDSGEQNLYLSDASHGMHRMYKSVHTGKKPIKINAGQIDRFEFPKLDFVKIDVEGTELSVIKGMINTINKTKPNMMIEFHPPTLVEAGTDPQYLYDLLQKLCYSIYLIPDLDNPISFKDLIMKTIEPSGQNIICLRN
jgi:FkbM family methyltransferase